MRRPTPQKKPRSPSARSSKRGALAALVRVLARPGSGDRADFAIAAFARRTLAPLLAPGAGNLRDDARAVARVLVELGLLDESAEFVARETSSAREAYEALVREAENDDSSNVKSESDAFATLRRVGRARVRRDARLRRRRARRRFFLQTRAALTRALRENGPTCALVLSAAFGNWPFSRHDGTALVPRLATRHAAALARSLKASFAFFARDGAGGTLPTYDSARTLIATHAERVGVSARAAGTFVRTGARGVFPTPETLANLLTKHARLASRAARGAFVSAFGSRSGSEPGDFAFTGGSGAARQTSGASGASGIRQRRVFVVPKHTESPGETRSVRGASASSSFGDEEAASSAREKNGPGPGPGPGPGGSSGVTRDRFLSGPAVGPRRPRHVELVASSHDPSPGSGDLLRWDRETPEQE